MASIRLVGILRVPGRVLTRQKSTELEKMAANMIAPGKLKTPGCPGSVKTSMRLPSIFLSFSSEISGFWCWMGLAYWKSVGVMGSFTSLVSFSF